ncbi:hypothetical protein BDV38DRAFT_114683 [Aspergillus pseudotamarii]|uniref:Transcriptional regulator n=1 Tax=Aspergillus pseudotamarii TaxID=132259 RepID=A0A5N6SR24_ASPPS|nr:uncharacterized protein BDV38DRAFT_114683 [Aspergillus pseudotamarii]KAE8136367.1 hypothetical protein BDV38DRAFT_114683 [Aspergillus pseudotamarii]
MAPRRRVVSDSESESDEPVAPSVPSDDALEKALRDTVAKVYKSGNMEELTVKRVRVAAEKALGVDEGFFKGSSTWKSKSDQIIKDEVEVQDKRAQEPESDEEPEPAPPAKKASSAKRTKLDNVETSRKRRKTSTPEPEDESEASASLDDASEEEVKKPAKKQSKPTLGKSSKPKPSKEQVSDDSEDIEDQKDDVPPSEEVEEPKNDRGEDSESEMSVVIDEEPKPTRKRQKSAGTEGSTQKGKKKTTTSKGKDADLDPDQKKIKELQDLLVKCGIRKLWWRLLAPYETSKEKIGHLEGMLREAGMTGPLKGKEAERKALKIRERRELQADVVSCQEEVKLYGKDGADEESDNGRPGRRLNRGRKHLAFLEDDGEETD